MNGYKSRFQRWTRSFILVAGLGLIHLAGCATSRPPVQAGISLQEALSDKEERFREVTPGRSFQFPKDHGPHRDFKTEWWYFTGNLKAKSGEAVGYQLTLFRVGQRPPGEISGHSSWNSQSLYMGHIGLSFPAQRVFYSKERLSRESVGLSGASEKGSRIWLENWEIKRHPAGWTLSAQTEEGLELDLELVDTKPPVLQGEMGYSRKGPLPKHASYYVSQTRLATTGSVVWKGESLEVTGQSWFDHEWSSQALAEGLVGWDWFSLQLDDGRDLMLYLLRYKDGTLEPASSGVIIDAEGGKKSLSLTDFKVDVTDHHKTQSGIRYPSRWKIKIVGDNFDLEVEPTMLEQEMTGRVPYWEGAVKVYGSHTGVGFVEMTGYAH